MDQKSNITNLMSRPVFISMFGLIMIFIIIMYLVIYDVKIYPSKSKEKSISDTIIILFSSMLFFGVCVLFFPYLNDFKQFLSQMHNIIYIVLFSIFVILFYILTPEPSIKKYEYLINPFIIGLGLISLYFSSSNVSTGFNLNFERIKMMFLLSSLVATFFVAYNADHTSVVSIAMLIASLFAFIYAIIIFTLPTNLSLNSYLGSFGFYGSVLYFIFMCITAYILYGKYKSLFEDRIKLFSIIMFLFIISILSGTLIGANLFSLTTDTGMADFSTISNVKNSLLTLFGLAISGFLIYYLSTQIERMGGGSNIISFIINISLTLLMLSLFYKLLLMLAPELGANKNPLFEFIFSSIMYIPSLITHLFEDSMKNITGEMQYNNKWNFVMLILGVVLLLAYNYSFIFLNRMNTLDGKQLVNQPVSLSKSNNLGNYLTLNKNENPHYQYALSCWIFIETAPPNTNSKYTQFTSLLNYGNKPKILYNAEKNTLRIVMQQQDLKQQTKNRMTDFDNEDNRIIYENKDVPLQKWNNIIMNFNSGTLDIFLNGKLVKSAIEVSPYTTYDELNIGEEQGILGGICNVLYFNKSLNITKINHLYNTVKHLSPPVFNDYKETIMV